jgi:uncharacterized protein YeaO (DUF488 family)
MIYIKRVYEPFSDKDGLRILVDRLWPRGLKKDTAHVDKWIKEVAPSTTLRKWFNHEPSKWQVFQSRYEEELKENAAVSDLLELTKVKKPVTLLFAAHDEEHNQAVVLRHFLERKSNNTS